MLIRVRTKGLEEQDGIDYSGKEPIISGKPLSKCIKKFDNNWTFVWKK